MLRRSGFYEGGVKIKIVASVNREVFFVPGLRYAEHFIFTNFSPDVRTFVPKMFPRQFFFNLVTQ